MCKERPHLPPQQLVLRYIGFLTAKGKKPFSSRRPGLLWQSDPGVLTGVMVCLRVLARTERVVCWRSCASSSFFSGHMAKSSFAWRAREARGMIKWLCSQDQLNPKVAIIFGTAARYH
jgi:hypothetical protein